MVDGEPVHGSRAIFTRLEELAPEPTLYPEPIADAVRAAEKWGEAEFQDHGRRIFWGAAHFRPNSMGSFGGPGPLDPATTDFAITLIRRVWKHRNITAGEVGTLLEGLPAELDRIDGYVAEGIMGGESPTAADLQIGATLGLLGTCGDIRPLIDARPSGEVLRRFFGEYEGHIPAGAFPDGWVPPRPRQA
jgi:glutathione S-transferase